MTLTFRQQLFAALLGLIVLACPFSSQAQERVKVVHVLGDAAWPPYHYPTEDNGFQGVFIEILDTLFEERLGMQIERHPLPWKRAQKEVETGIADIMVTIPTPARDKYCRKTAIPLYRMYLHFYTYADHPLKERIEKVKTAEDIQALGLTLAAHRGDGWYKANIAAKGVKTHYVNADEHIIRFVAARRADGMFEPLLPASRSIHELGLESEITLTGVKFGPMDFYLLISKKSPLVDRMDEINKALRQMKRDGTIDGIVARYYDAISR